MCCTRANEETTRTREPERNPSIIPSGRARVLRRSGDEIQVGVYVCINEGARVTVRTVCNCAILTLSLALPMILDMNFPCLVSAHVIAPARYVQMPRCWRAREGERERMKIRDYRVINDGFENR